MPKSKKSKQVFVGGGEELRHRAGQADVSLSKKEVEFLIAVLDDEKYRCPEPRGPEGCSCEGCAFIDALVKKLKPS